MMGHVNNTVGDLEAGMLLLASPELLDPNFADTVVLLLDVNDEGALGVVLNRPSALPVSEVLADWGDVVEEPEVLFQGGPVSTDGALAVALASPGGEDAVGFRSVAERLGLLDLDTPTELVVGTVERLRIFAGYAGWGAGQLEGEIEEGSWYVVPGRPRTCSGSTPTTSGATSCAASRATSRSTPPAPSTPT